MEEALEEIINMCSFDDTEKLDRLKNLAESSANFDAKKFELITGINTEKEGNE